VHKTGGTQPVVGAVTGGASYLLRGGIFPEEEWRARRGGGQMVNERCLVAFQDAEPEINPHPYGVNRSKQ